MSYFYYLIFLIRIGLVLPARDEGPNCNASVAFASVTAIETCIKKLTGKLVSMSVSQLLDCANGFQKAVSCVGAPLSSYLNWVKWEEIRLTSSALYPYRGRLGTCPASVEDKLKLNAVVDNDYVELNTSEEVLKERVAKFSVVLVSLTFTAESLKAFKNYKGGVFNGCSSSNQTPVGGRAVAVVGYGTEGGKDYWLIKNNWGPAWGEKGFMKLRRGVNACNITKVVDFIDCRIG